MAASEFDIKVLQLQPSEHQCLTEYLSIAITSLLEAAKDAEVTRRPIADQLRNAAGEADTLRDKIRRL
jgi:hypothetical protein